MTQQEYKMETGSILKEVIMLTEKELTEEQKQDLRDLVKRHENSVKRYLENNKSYATQQSH